MSFTEYRTRLERYLHQFKKNILYYDSTPTLSETVANIEQSTQYIGLAHHIQLKGHQYVPTDRQYLETYFSHISDQASIIYTVLISQCGCPYVLIHFDNFHDGVLDLIQLMYSRSAEIYANYPTYKIVLLGSHDFPFSRCAHEHFVLKQRRSPITVHTIYWIYWLINSIDRDVRAYLAGFRLDGTLVETCRIRYPGKKRKKKTLIVGTSTERYRNLAKIYSYDPSERPPERPPSRPPRPNHIVDLLPIISE